MPVQVVKSLEEEQWQKLGAPVFVRGQLRSYARLLDVDVGSCWNRPRSARWFRPPWSVIPIPACAPHRREPRPARAVGITAVLAVPVWFATRGHFDDSATPSPNTASLDAIPAAVPVTRPQPVPTPRPRLTRPPPRPASRPPPVRGLAGPVPRPAPAPAAAGNTLEMQFSGDSWVDIGGPDGSTVEKALIRSGETRSFTPGQVTR